MLPVLLPLVTFTVTFDVAFRRLSTRSVTRTVLVPERRALALPSAASARSLVPLAPRTVHVTARLLEASLQVTVTFAAADFATAPAGAAATGATSALTSGAEVVGGVSGVCGVSGVTGTSAPGFSFAHAAIAAALSSGPVTAFDGPW